MAEINTENNIKNTQTMDEHKTYMDRILTVPSGGSNSAELMAMYQNNPFMYLILLALFGNGNFMNGGNRGGAEYAALQAQMNDNNNNQIAREAIQGNTFAISQLSQNLNVDYNALTQAVNTVNFGIAQLGSQTGMGFAGVTNAINLGNLNIIQQLKDCCCNMQTQVLNQGYQNQIQTINKTNDLQTAMRVESGLTRTEVASFRQAWENSRYQDVVAEKTRLQTELDLLRTERANTTAYQQALAPIQAQLNTLSAAVLYNAKPYAVTQTAQQQG